MNFPNHRILSEHFIENLSDTAKALPVRHEGLGDPHDLWDLAVQLTREASMSHAQCIAADIGAIEKHETKALEELALGVSRLAEAGLISEILLPAIGVQCAQTDLNIRRMVGVHVLPADGHTVDAIFDAFRKVFDPQAGAKIVILGCTPLGGGGPTNDAVPGSVLWYVTRPDGLVVSHGVEEGAASSFRAPRARARERAVGAWELHIPADIPLPKGFEGTAARLERERLAEEARIEEEALERADDARRFTEQPAL